MFDMDKETTEGMINVAEAAAEKLEKGAVDTYKAIEHGVVGAYKKVEDTVVGAFNHMTDSIVGAVLTREGETVEEAKARMAADTEKRMAENQRRVQESLEASRNAGKQ